MEAIFDLIKVAPSSQPLIVSLVGDMILIIPMICYSLYERVSLFAVKFQTFSCMSVHLDNKIYPQTKTHCVPCNLLYTKFCSYSLLFCSYHLDATSFMKVILQKWKFSRYIYFRAFHAPTWLRENKSVRICSFCA